MISRARFQLSAVVGWAFFLAASLAGCDAADPGTSGSVYGTTRVAGTDSVLVGVRLALAGQSTVSGDDGKYRFDDIPVGTWTVEASAEGFGDYARELKVGEGRTVFDPRLTVITVWGSLGGRVINRRDRNLAGAAVRLGSSTTLTDPTGTFLFEAVPVGRQSLTVSMAGYRTHEDTVVARAEGSSVDVFLSAVSCGMISGLDLTKDPLGDANDVTITWNPVPMSWTAICDTIRVERFRGADSQATVVNLTVDQTRYEDRDLAVGSYTYRVGIVNIDGEIGPWVGFTSTSDSVRVFALGLVRIEPGTFLMGSDQGESWEQPIHEVVLTRPFALGRHEVTRGEFYSARNQTDPTRQNPDLPMVPASRSSIVAWLEDLSLRENIFPCYRNGEPVASFPDCPGYRLPTEAEWEYAARAGSTSEYFFGPDAASLGAYAWTEFNAGAPPALHPVELKSPNPWGLYDVYGNAAETVQDDFDPEWYSSGVRIDPIAQSSGSWSFRGGGVAGETSPSTYRSASRQWPRPGFAEPPVGFRIARTLPR